MIRDMDLVRRILLTIRNWEGRPDIYQVYASVKNLAAEDHDPDPIRFMDDSFHYHMEIMIAENLIQCSHGAVDCFDEFFDIVLTWTGQDLASNIANDSVWNRVHGKMRSSGLTAIGFELIKKFATEFTAQQFRS
ncbi:DUF2513 domain-containing protein [Stieleria sp. TO1_6]|nr:DUF2513 domain-containing protein [Stieleria tagensis]